MDRTTFTSSVFYRDPKAALDWLERAFGFEVTMAIDGPPEAPEMCHYEMSCAGRGCVMVGAEWADWARSPAGTGGVVTQAVHVDLAADVSGGIDAHCERARAAGAPIAAEPEDQFYGDRTYRAVDPEGHRWVFAARVRDVTRAEAEAAIGLAILAT
ncbi:MAG: VOC family protein, partial [Acidimicrobiia bacterium]|nr:VOC family protein [Acidimicrobiia bacterium]